MRFDDMLATVLARGAETPAGRMAQWRQLLDLLAQRRSGGDPERGRAALDRLQSIRAEVPVPVRRETARAFSGRAIPAALVAFLAADVPVVAGAILGHVRLTEGEWLAILPRLSPTGRGFLRHRRDLGPRVVRALAGFGASDMALASAAEVAAVTIMEARHHAAAIAGEPADEAVVGSADVAPPAPPPSLPPTPLPPPPLPPVAVAAVEDDPHDGPGQPASTPFEPETGEGQIRAILSRIAYFQTAPRPDAAPEPATAFRFETGADGLIRWVEGAARGPLIGETIATAAEGPYGVDAQAPGAFGRRAPFRNARLVVPGVSTAGGEWRIAGVPVFSALDGRFQGYRGSGRRPRPDELVASDPEARPAGIGLQPDSLRQLVHELRTPLNAIGGFAEMIRRQMRGPVSTSYRDRAQRIIDQAGQLLAAVDDLDVAARLETRRLDLQSVDVDLVAMTKQVCTHHEPVALRRAATLVTEAEAGLGIVVGDPAALRRMVSRLVTSCIALAGRGEAILVALDGSAGVVTLAVTRPERLSGLTDDELLDPSYGPDGDWPDAPLLGLGFSLHLVRRLAAAAGGRLVIDIDRFVLHLPMHAGALAAAGA